MLDFFARACRLRILGPPTLQEARAVPRPEPVSSQDDFSTTLHWGPVPSFASRLAGGRFPTSSLMLVPYIPEPVRIAALNEIPKDVLPCEGDTVRSLVARLSTSSFLEDSHVLRGGKGPGRVRLNSTSYPQPRRRSWSVVVEPPHEDADGDHISILFNYTAYGRLPSDWHARAMPRAIWDLNLILWRASFPFLTEVSQRSPPTGCQLLLYYTLFQSCMGRHRDNYTSEQMMEVIKEERTIGELVEGSHHGGDANYLGRK